MTAYEPCNKEEVHNKKSLGIVWHEGIMGRKDEDVCSELYGWITVQVKTRIGL